MKMEEIATIKGVGVPSISKRLKRAGVQSAQLAAFREDKSLIIEGIQQKMLNALNDDKKIASMSGKDLTISAAVLIDKQRLLDGHTASGGNISLLVIANKVHAQYQSAKGGDEQHVIEAEVVPTEQETEEVGCGEA